MLRRSLTACALHDATRAAHYMCPNGHGFVALEASHGEFSVVSLFYVVK
jgi:hypothetical protein